MVLVVLLCILSIIVPFVAYPLLLALRATLWPDPIRRAAIHPSVDLIIAAHDEADSIRARLENARALDYPSDRLSIWVASDGSTDGTVEIARRFEDRGVRVLDLPRGGKAAALIAAVAASDGEILAFSDANSEWAPDALKNLVYTFADDRVGGAAGDQRYAESPSRDRDALGERSYWSFDRILKRWQSRAGNAISATGAIYAIRRSCFDPPPPDATDDFMISTGVIAARRRLVFAEDAVAFEPPAEESAGEFRRKVRIITRGLRAVVYRRALLNPMTSGLYSIELLVHKLWRRLTWLPALGLVGVWPWTLAAGGTAFLISSAALVGSLLGLAGTLWPALCRFRLVALARYVLMVNAACAVATFKTLRGERVARWENERSRAAVSEASS